MINSYCDYYGNFRCNQGLICAATICNTVLIPFYNIQDPTSNSPLRKCLVTIHPKKVSAIPAE